MYNIPPFNSGEHQAVIAFMQQHSFVVLAGVDQSGAPVATHIPVLIQQREQGLFLVGHIMKQTDHHKAFQQNNQVLAIFTGPHAYISASWYVKPQQASTWNYTTVHATGTLRFLDDDRLLQVLQATTRHFEGNDASPALVEEMSQEYVHRLMKAIIAFEIQVSDLNHVFKLSQNKDTETHRNIVAHLAAGDDNSRAIGVLMEQRKL